MMKWIVALFVGCVVVADAAAAPRLKPTRLAKDAKGVCQTSACFDTARKLQESMDTSADPCDNFFQFACGGYVKRIPASVSDYGRFQEVDLELKTKLKNMFQQPATGNEPAVYKKARDFYASCLNTGVLQQYGVQPLRDLIATLGGMPATDYNWSGDSTFSWQSLLQRLWGVGLGYNYLFKMDLGISFTDENSRPVLLQVPQKFILSPNALAMGQFSQEYQQAYRNLVSFLQVMGADAQTAATDVSNLLAMERQLYAAAQRPDSRSLNSTLKTEDLPPIEASLPDDLLKTMMSEDFIKLRNMMRQNFRPLTLQILQQGLPSVNWSQFFRTFLNVNDLSRLQILASSFNYIDGAVQIFDGSPKRIVANYLVIRALLDTAGNVMNNGRDLRETLLPSLAPSSPASPAAKGEKQQADRGLFCVAQVNEKLGMLVGAMYVDKVFTPATKTTAEDMVASLRTTIKARMERATWMDAATKAKAIEKLLAVKQTVAYPPETVDRNKVQQVHQNVIIMADRYFANQLVASKLAHDLDVSQYGVSFKAGDWIRMATSVTLVNANYHPLTNGVYMPAGILNGAFFDANRPQSMNFGGIGAVIGHEFTHGFDTTGRQYDKDGKQNNWWSASTLQQFDQKAQCLIDQYSATTVPELGRKLNGAMTITEDIADNGGFRQAYEAYLEWSKTNEPEPLLPGINYNHRQLLWLSNANVWCTKTSLEQMQWLLENDVHTLPKYRVLVGLSNFEEFANDFQCKPGSAMNPAKKCGVW